MHPVHTRLTRAFLNAKENAFITLGLMSGTSLDGTDAVAIRFGQSRPEFLGHSHIPFSASLKNELLSLCQTGVDEIERMGKTQQALADNYIDAIQEVLTLTGLSTCDIAASGIHGQTIRHCPQQGFTLQLNDPARIAEKTGIPVIADFRSRDIAAGGEGAPLVPAFHASIMAGDMPRAIVNIGGISNISALPSIDDIKHGAAITGFDCGPGNMLLDAWCQRHLGCPFDKGGAWAACGQVIPSLLDKALSDPYFARGIPKSTGREYFSQQWLDSLLSSFSALAPQDVARTLSQISARGITDAIQRFFPQARSLYICGGGVFNLTLMRDIATFAQDRLTLSTSALGIDPMQVEAAAFAWLAFAFLSGMPGNLPAVTGAKGPRTLGAYYPA